jgi:drug/metabolite transporter (DMT)-like permease
MFLWGISWISAKYISMHYSHIELTFWRFILVSFASLVSLKLLGLKVDKFSWIGFLWIVCGAIAMGISQLMNFLGLEHGYAGFGSIVFNSTSPLFSFLLAMIFYGKKLNKREYIGLFIGAFGVISIFRVWSLDIYEILNASNIYFILNSITFAITTICSQVASKYMNSATFSLGLGAVASLAILPFCDIYKLVNIFSLDYVFWTHLIFNAVIAGGFGTTAHFYVASKIGGEAASSYIFLTPLVSVLASYIVYDEQIGFGVLIGAALAMSAVYMLNSSKNR